MYHWTDGSNYLMHHGIKGQKWGQRNYQYEDGTLTPEGILRYRKMADRNKARQNRRRVGSVLSTAGAAGAVAGGIKAASIADLMTTSVIEFGKLAMAKGSIAAATQYVDTMVTVAAIAPYAAAGMAAVGATLAIGAAVAGHKRRKAQNKLDYNEAKREDQRYRNGG